VQVGSSAVRIGTQLEERETARGRVKSAAELLRFFVQVVATDPQRSMQHATHNTARNIRQRNVPRSRPRVPATCANDRSGAAAVARARCRHYGVQRSLLGSATGSRLHVRRSPR
jgi:5,10-methylenetetrahydrofolate reductase